MQANRRSEKRIKMVLCAICAGMLNGLLGTGGGIPLWFAAVGHGDRRRAFATSSAGVLLLSLFSLFLSGDRTEGIAALPPPMLLLAVLGGAFGGALLGKLPLRLLKWIFAGLLFASGIYTLARVLIEVL